MDSHQQTPREIDPGWEAWVASVAADFAYPETPPLVVDRPSWGAPGPARPGPRRLAWAAVFVVALLLGLLAVPPLRAAVLDFLQIGAVRIFLPGPTATALPGTPAPTPGAPTVEPGPTATPTPLALAGEIDLAAARERVSFPLRLPTYPPQMGPPDRVYLQHRGGPILIFVWTAADDPERVEMALYQLGEGAFMAKGEMSTVAETTVNGRQAVWVEGIHILQIEGGGEAVVRLVDSNVLVWTEEVAGQEITYRLETDLAPEEAVRIASSLEQGEER